MIKSLLQFVMATFLFNGIFFLLTVRQINRTNEAVVHIHDVRSQVYRTQADIQDVETGQWGYLLTLLPEFKEPYEAGKKYFPEDIAQLLSMLPEGSTERAICWNLKKLGGDKIVFATGVVQQADAKMNLPLDPQVSLKGKRIMDKCRGQVKSILAVEDKLLARQREILRRTCLFTMATFIVANDLIFLLLYWVLRLSRLQPTVPTSTSRRSPSPR